VVTEIVGVVANFVVLIVVGGGHYLHKRTKNNNFRVSIKTKYGRAFHNSLELEKSSLIMRYILKRILARQVHHSIDIFKKLFPSI